MPNKSLAPITKELIQSINTPKHLTFRSNQTNLQSRANKARILGRKVIEHEDITTIYLDDKVEVLSEHQLILPKQSQTIFAYTKFKSIDLSDVDLSTVENLISTFEACDASEINFGTNTLPRIKSMGCTFSKCRLNKLDLKSLDVRNLISVNGIFSDSTIKTLNIENLNLKALNDIGKAFNGATIKTLRICNLSNIKYDNILWKFETFNDCEIEKLVVTKEIYKTLREQELFKIMYVGEVELLRDKTIEITRKLITALNSKTHLVFRSNITPTELKEHLEKVTKQGGKLGVIDNSTESYSCRLTTDSIFNKINLKPIQDFYKIKNSEEQQESITKINPNITIQNKALYKYYIYGIKLLDGTAPGKLIITEFKNNLTVLTDKQLTLSIESTALFEDTSFKSIDLSEVIIPSESKIDSLFNRCKAEEINLTSLGVERVNSLHEILDGYESNSVILDDKVYKKLIKQYNISES